MVLYELLDYLAFTNLVNRGLVKREYLDTFPPYGFHKREVEFPCCFTDMDSKEIVF